MPPIYTDIANRLARDITEGRLSRLPGARTLATRYDCSFATMLKALRVLRDRGVIVIDGNRRARVAGAPETPAPQRPSSERLYETLRTQITDGVYRAGDRLPKADFFALEHGCSRGTVAKALRMLETERLCHRHGRAWVVGPVQVEVGSPPPESRPAIVVLLPNEDHWRMLSREPKEFKRFMAQFAAESEKHGIRLVMAFTDRQDDRTLRALCPQGREQIARRIEELDSHYLGAFVPFNHLEVPDLEHWLRWLLERGRPVVWLDRAEESLSSRITHKLFYRFHADSREGARCILESFHRAGHRHVGIPRLRWHLYMDSFIRDMQAMAGTFTPPLSITVEREEHGEMDDRIDDLTTGEVLTRLSRTGVPPKRKLAADLLKRHPDLTKPDGLHPGIGWRDFWRAHYFVALKEFQVFHLTSMLTPLLRDTPITALVCPGNKNTRFWFWWFNAAGIQVPRDVSVISVDNSFDFHPWPISSIDLGYDYLGYAAVHVFMGDIPVRVDRHRNVTGKVRFFERGSVGAPREGKIRVDLAGEVK